MSDKKRKLWIKVTAIALAVLMASGAVYSAIALLLI